MHSADNTWFSPDKVMVTRMYEAGAPLREIASAVGRSEDAIRRAVGRWKLHRPEGHVGVETRANLAWPRICAALKQSGGMTIAEICQTTGMFKSVVLRAISGHRSEMHVTRWIPTTRKPTAVWSLGARIDAPKPVKSRQKQKSANPFLVAAGLVQIPQGGRGRVFQQSMSFGDESEAA